MLKTQMILILIMSITLSNSSKFIYDSENDIIYFNNLKYIQIKYNIKSDIDSLYLTETHTQEVLTTGSFYYYVIMSACK